MSLPSEPPPDVGGGNVFASGYSPGPLPGLPTSSYGGYAAGPIDSRARNALVLGVLGIFPLSILAGIPAIVTGRRALERIRLSEGALRGRAAARCAIALGFLSVLILVVALIAIYA